MGSGTPLEHIDAVDAFARTLYLRVESSSSPILTQIASPLQQLHLALRHLRVEVADPDSLLRSADTSVYARQLRPVIEDCDFALKQLEAVLERQNVAAGGTDDLADRIAAVRSRLASETTSVNMFLDTVQLHNPVNNAPEALISANDIRLDSIKDKVDTIATRLFQRWNTGGGIFIDEDRMWQEFKAELEKEGFSPSVLQQHKEVLRAYIRELQSMSPTNGGAPPTVRGLLEHEGVNQPPPLNPYKGLESSKVVYPCADNDKFDPSIKTRSHAPNQAQAVVGHARGNNYSSSSSEAFESEGNDSLALISTKDLMDLDNITSRMGKAHLDPNSHLATPRSSKRPEHSSPAVAGSWPPSRLAAGSSDRSLSLSSSPLPSDSAQSLAPSESAASPRMPSRLAPDRYGKEIEMNAPWTKIRRSLVSPEVLERARVRYEARPEFVAVLGRLTREQIEEFARQSADCRAARLSNGPASFSYEADSRRHRTGCRKNHRDDDDDQNMLHEESDVTDDEDVDSSDDRASGKEVKNYPYIVSPPDKKTPTTLSATTVMPKPILKNKNENHVRFDPEPHEIYAKGSRSYDEGAYERRGSRRHRDRRDSGGRREDKVQRIDNRPRQSNHHEHRRDRREERPIKKRSWGDAIGAVGIGGAAASLLGVLAEAAVGS